MKTFIIFLLSVAIIIQDIKIKWLEDEIEAIKSWYPFCQLLKIKIPEKDDFK